MHLTVGSQGDVIIVMSSRFRAAGVLTLSGEGKLLLHNTGEEEHIWHLSDAPGCLLILSCPILMVVGQL